MKDKSGKEITGKEFMTRWKQGINGITPLQMAKSNQYGFYLILIGIITGIVTSIIYKQWWLLIILIGSIIVQGMGLIANIQRIKQLKAVEEMMKPQPEQEIPYVQ